MLAAFGLGGFFSFVEADFRSKVFEAGFGLTKTRIMNKARERGLCMILRSGIDQESGLMLLAYAFQIPVISAQPTIRRVIEAGAGRIVKKHKNRWTPLHNTSRFGHTTCVELFVKGGADIQELATYCWNPPSFCSTKCIDGHLSIIHLALGILHVWNYLQRVEQISKNWPLITGIVFIFQHEMVGTHA